MFGGGATGGEKGQLMVPFVNPRAFVLKEMARPEGFEPPTY
jgi:hypothetical protein